MTDSSNLLWRIGLTDFLVYGGAIKGDITRCDADVLVSSAGTDATMSSGVSQAILAAGGSEILSALQAHRPLVPGDVVITSAGKLRAKNIYHAVVVGWGDEKRVLQASVWRVVSRCMTLAQQSGMTSIAFPSLGTRAGGAEHFETHSTMVAACLEALHSNTPLRRILFCFDYPPTAEIFRRAFLQQKFIRQVRGLVTADANERDEITLLVPKIFSQLFRMDASVERIENILQRLEKNPSVTEIRNIYTEGGAYFASTVNASGNARIVGRDDHSTAGLSREEVTQLFRSIYQQIDAKSDITPRDKEELKVHVQDVEAEVSRKAIAEITIETT